ncbi:carbon starvation CstA family protein [Shigella flexneri]
MVDPLGGINTLWPLFGIANQMLAGMALMLCAVVLFKMNVNVTPGWRWYQRPGC